MGPLTGHSKCMLGTLDSVQATINSVQNFKHTTKVPTSNLLPFGTTRRSADT
jgi:hypothetical protein